MSKIEVTYHINKNVIFSRKISLRNATPIYNEVKEISATNVNEMLVNIWKIIIESDNVAWSADVPNIANNQIDKFAQILDIKWKRNYNQVNISSDLLVHLRNKEIPVHIFEYSRNVATNGTFKIVKKNLLDPAVRGRSATVANQVIDEIIVKLKKTHSHHLITPQPIGMRIWTSFIASKPTASREQLIMDSPPDHIVTLFRNIPTSEAEVLTNAKQVYAKFVNMFNDCNQQWILVFENLEVW